mgnify:CR=1 FL=1
MESVWRTHEPSILLESDLASRIRVKTKLRDLCFDEPVAICDDPNLFCWFETNRRKLPEQMLQVANDPWELEDEGL